MKNFNDLTEFELKQAFFIACSHNDLKTVESLVLNSHKKNIEPSIDDNNGLRLACLYGSLDVVKFLLTNEFLKDKVNIHANNDSSFKLACRMNKNEVVSFLINDFFIEKTKSIDDFFKKNSFPNIEKLFILRTKQLSLKLK